MRRVVVDPGVLVSAIITPAGPPAEVLRAVRDSRLDIIASPRLLAELAAVFRREKFRRYVSVAEADEYVEGLALLAETVSDPEPMLSLTRDPGDDYVVALARSAGATTIVSGDTDLLALEPPDPPALTPREILEKLSSASG